MNLWVCVLLEINGEGYGYTCELLVARGVPEGETLAECKTGPNGPW
jgi:hypothetical protein